MTNYANIMGNIKFTAKRYFTLTDSVKHYHGTMIPYLIIYCSVHRLQMEAVKIGKAMFCIIISGATIHNKVSVGVFYFLRVPDQR